MSEALPVASAVITLTGGVTPNQLALPSVDIAVPLREIAIQADPANAGVMYIGGPNVTSTNYGVIVPIPVSSIPSAPFVLGEFDDGSVSLGAFYVLGTANDKVHILVLPYN